MKTRITQPKNNKYYIRKVSGGLNGAVAGSPTITGANVLCNCVGYANGRFNEIINDPELRGITRYFKYQLTCNAENFIESAKSQGLKISDTPIQGGVMVWKKGATLGGGDGAGHVAVVEEVYNDGTILTSESGYGAWAFKTIHRDNTNKRWGQPAGYTFRGCIINPGVKNPKIVPPPKLTIDGIGGPETVRAMQRFFSTTRDGIISGQNKTLNKYYPALKSVEYGTGGSPCVKKLQKWIGVDQDGVIGSKTVKAWQKKLDVDVDGVFGSNSMKAWQKYLNTHDKAKYPKKDALQPWYDAMTEQFEWSKNQEYDFVTPTIATSRNKGTCITFPAVSLQRLGLMPSGGYFYLYPKTMKIAGNKKGVDYVNAHPEIYSVSYPKKTIKELGTGIKKGDIIGFGGSDYHTMVYIGKNSSGTPIFNTMGHYKGLGVTYSNYANRKIDMLVRIKIPK